MAFSKRVGGPEGGGESDWKNIKKKKLIIKSEPYVNQKKSA